MELDAPEKRYSYAKHYTPPKFSVGISQFVKKLIKRLPSRLTVMDPSCGNMDLLRAFNMVFGDRLIRFLGIDIYPEKNLPFAAIRGNAFQVAPKYYGKSDVIITNPPFGRKGHPSLDPKTQVEMDNYFFELLEEIKLEKAARQQVTLEIAFLGLAVKMLKGGGTCAIVLPESVFTCASYRNFRISFEKRFLVIGILQLPVSAFAGSNATASTAVLVFKNNLPKTVKYNFPVQDEKEEIIEVSSGQGTWFPFKDMDFMGPPADQEALPWKSLGDLFPNVTIRSGFKGKQPTIKSSAGAGYSGKYISSKFISRGKLLIEDSPFVNLDKTLERTAASPGDILLVRSGSGCLGKVAIVAHSKYPIIPRSEIYILSGFSSAEQRNVIFQSIQLATINSSLPWWAKILGRGVGTPNLNKEEIYKIPILDMKHGDILRLTEKLNKKTRKAG